MSESFFHTAPLEKASQLVHTSSCVQIQANKVDIRRLFNMSQSSQVNRLEFASSLSLLKPCSVAPHSWRSTDATSQGPLRFYSPLDLRSDAQKCFPPSKTMAEGKEIVKLVFFKCFQHQQMSFFLFCRVAVKLLCFHGLALLLLENMPSVEHESSNQTIKENK